MFGTKTWKNLNVDEMHEKYKIEDTIKKYWERVTLNQIFVS